MTYSLRPATEQDQEVLLTLYASTRTDELQRTGWNGAQIEAFVRMQHQAQQTHYAQNCPNAQIQLIVQHDEVVGRLWTEQRPAELHVLDIALLPHARGRGLGTQCLRVLMQEAAARAVPLSIYVEQDNPARRLYERLGFVAEGEVVGIHQSMAWHPATQIEECLS